MALQVNKNVLILWVALFVSALIISFSVKDDLLSTIIACIGLILFGLANQELTAEMIRQRGNGGVNVTVRCT